MAKKSAQKTQPVDASSAEQEGAVPDESAEADDGSDELLAQASSDADAAGAAVADVALSLSDALLSGDLQTALQAGREVADAGGDREAVRAAIAASLPVSLLEPSKDAVVEQRPSVAEFRQAAKDGLAVEVKLRQGDGPRLIAGLVVTGEWRRYPVQQVLDCGESHVRALATDRDIIVRPAQE